MPRFSANIGFLWPELSFVERIRAAADAGFTAVECHFPYEESQDSVRGALAETGVQLLGLNTRLGVNGPEDFGVAARPDRVEEARTYIDEAIAYAVAVGCLNVNVVPGRTGRDKACELTFRDNLGYACERAAAVGKGVLIETINTRAAPDFHMSLTREAVETIDAVGADNLKLMFDCFHVQIMEGDLLSRLKVLLPYIGHVQVSAVHDRGEPDAGEIDYPWLLGELDALGWTGFVGAEYQPRATTSAGLGWMDAYR